MLVEDLFPYALFLLLFLTGLIAGMVDAIVGGGGLISLPVLLATGIPPQFAIGTNKLQGLIGTCVATYGYYRQGLLSFNVIYRGLIAGIIGTLLGALTSQLLSSDVLSKIIPLLLVLILVYTLFSPKLGLDDKQPKFREFGFYIICGFLLGFYDGFFGPGTGSLWIFSLTFFLGYNFVKATAYTKVFNLKSSLIATICFTFGQNIDYQIALCMGIGQIIGGKLGVYFAIKNGARLIRPIFISVVSLTIATLVYRNLNGTENILRLIHEFGWISATLMLIIPTIGIISLYLRYAKRQSNLEG